MKKLVSLLVVLVNLVGATSIFAYSDTDNSSYKSAIDELSQLGISTVLRTALSNHRTM